jgi:hypothetical protein
MNALFREWVEYGQVIGQPSIGAAVRFPPTRPSLGEAGNGSCAAQDFGHEISGMVKRKIGLQENQR